MFSISISCPPNHKHLARSFSICQTTNAETDIIKPKVWEGGKKKLTTVLVFDSVVDQYYKPNRTLMINSRDVVNEFLAANDWAHFHFKTALSRLLFGCLLSQSIARSPTQSSCLD